MLTLHTCDPRRSTVDPPADGKTLPAGVAWIDMQSADAREVAVVEAMTGRRVPTLADLAEVESSSRHFREGDALYLSNPIVFRNAAGGAQVTPMGFVLTPTLVITIHFEAIKAVDEFARQLAKPDHHSAASIDVFVGILETMVDHMADVLENVAVELDGVSQRIFLDDEATHARRPKREIRALRATLKTIGQNGDRASKIRHSLLGIGRLLPYVEANAEGWLSEAMHARIETLRQDVTSLDDYETRLSDKVQFLLDSTLGFTSIDQNATFNILTIVSVVGITPTLIAGIYGMNFKMMPELEWAWGYPYGLGLIALSAIIPLAWFKAKGWF